MEGKNKMIVCDRCSDVVEGKVSKAKLELTVSKIRNYKPLEMDLCEKCIEELWSAPGMEDYDNIREG